MNYMNLNQHPVQLSFYKDRTHEFVEVFHAHQGMELLYVHEGSGTAIVEQQIFDLMPGTLIYFKPFQLHRIRINVGPEQPYIRTLFVFEPAVLDEALAPFPSLRTFFQTLWKDPLAPQILHSPAPDQTDALLRSYLPRLTQTQTQPSLLLEEQLLFLTAYLHHWKHIGFADAGSKRPAAARKASSTAEKVMEWIEVHYMEPFELDRLAHEVHLSPNHVSAVFRQSVGSSITDYLTARRIRQACWLLKTTDLSVQEIGLAVGLGNFSYFCQLFKKHVGITPNRFKQQPQ
ncbi:AraC family transcriptional regulator [Paenibacillus cremeus]|uniref:AraC family transcriptional regulator n=1 Tax=Paenibacillus cremeus TaxID=2163881 RepID=A0A559K993_9BACL|nr:AraC family transcriptional regulator [Paenibacillus cremeus]TVY08700.1 AraC family transcriptional regulator [Paenibacillus cremeus]